MTNIFN